MRPGSGQAMSRLYASPQDIDLFIGGVSELPEEGIVGPTFSCIIGEQFKRIKDGDRFWFDNRNQFSLQKLNEIKKTTLTAVMCSSGPEINQIQPFSLMNANLEWNQTTYCENIQEPNLHFWRN